MGIDSGFLWAAALTRTDLDAVRSVFSSSCVGRAEQGAMAG